MSGIARRLVDAAEQGIHNDSPGDSDIEVGWIDGHLDATARSATIAVLKEFTKYLDELAQYPDKHDPDYLYLVGIQEGMEQSAIHAHDIAVELEES